MADNQPQSSAPDFDPHQGAIPRHVAIIMDGNNRWARKQGMPSEEGHRAGEATVQAIIRQAAHRGIEVLTLFAFSSENWRRPQAEVDHLMALFLKALSGRVEELHGHGVRIRFIGDRAAFTKGLQEGMGEAEALTEANTRMTVVIAVNYGGQWDIAHAARQLAEKVAAGDMRAEDVNPKSMAPHLAMADLPAPDLLIRTGGDQRISNFLLWQLAYSELCFSTLLWPDFDADAFDAALQDYAGRQRRFGRSGDEVASLSGEQ